MKSTALCVVGWICAALLGCDCSAPSHPAPDSGASSVEPAMPLDVDPDVVDFSANPALLRRLREHPHNYLRFINVRFASAVCARFDAATMRSPRVNLHGDAHLEQYAVTDLGRGLTDFDGATEGPAVLDLVRMGTSIRLACAAHGWEEHEASLFSAFMAGYRSGISDASSEPPPEPPTIQRMRSHFSGDRSRLLRDAESLADPLTPEDTEAARTALRPYFEAQRAEAPALDPRFFELVSIGRLEMGIGSALDEKYLLRVRGPTDAADDDEILEAKEVHPIADIPCVVAGDAPDPFRILVGESRIAYAPFPYLGYVQAGGTVFWLHGWTANYREISVQDSLSTPADLLELVQDIGVQLGRGHVNRIAAPLDIQLRRAVTDYLEDHEPAIRAAVVELGDATHIAWQRFVRTTDDHPALGARGATPASAFHHEEPDPSGDPGG